MKRLIYIPILLAFLVGAASCEREDLLADDDVERVDNLPIQIMATIGDAADTRSVDKAKREFTTGDAESGVPGDIIHVHSSFALNDGSTLTRYCAMKYTEDGGWMPMGNASFAWPNNADTGTFTAYYLYGSSGELTSNVVDGETSVTQTKFTDIVDGQDPLRAYTESVPYGHTVGLQFEHLLTHLTLIEMSAGIDDELVFYVDSDLAAEKNKHRFKNAFELNLVDGTNGPKIEVNYVEVYEALNGDKLKGAMIKAPTQLVRDRETRAESCQVGFFLEPGCLYNTFSIYYSNGDRYLSYVNSDPNAQDKTLDSNNRYTFNVKKSAGVTISTPPEQKWDESEEFMVVVDAERFLNAIYNNSEYSQYDEKKQEEVLILEATTNPTGTLLKYNVKFANPYYHVFPHPETTDADGNPVTPYDFVPSVGGDNVFDGGYHYIMDLRCPLFFENHGTIKNLGLSGSKIGTDEQYGVWISDKNYSQEGAVKTYEYNRTGALTTHNFGIVQNMRVKDIEVNVAILAVDDQEAHNVGALVGSNEGSGYISEVYLSSSLKITVNNGGSVIPEVNIGGLAGQNLGTMTGFSQLVDNRDPNKKPAPAALEITNLLKGGSGAYYIGGLVGNNTGKLSDVSIPTVPTDANGQVVAVKIDSSTSSGVVSDIGGIAGKADSSQGNEISSCLIGSGVLKAGSTEKYQMVDAYSYTGGIVGVLSERTHVFNCTTFCSVYGSFGSAGDGVSRAAGGAFGNIKAIVQGENTNYVPGEMSSIAAFGDDLEGANRGCFVGEAPAGKTWEDDYESKADVKKFDDIEYIGTNTK